MKPYCEIVVLKLLPKLRAMIAKELIDNYDYTQQQAAKKLGITQSAISQYIRKLRGSQLEKIEKDEKVFAKIQEFASRIASEDLKDQYEALASFCLICKTVRREGLLCDSHHKQIPAMCDCTICKKS